MKFGPLYTLKIEVNPDQKTGQAQDHLIIELPFAVEFQIERKNLAAAQTATFLIRNLGEKTRNLIYKDRYAFNDYRGIQFSAGYEDIGKPQIFNGQVAQAYSERSGVDMITTIECFEGYAMANGVSFFTMGSGVKFSEILRKLNNDLPMVSNNPIIGDFPNVTSRGSTYIGNTWNYLLQTSNGLATIDNGQLKALQPNEAFEGGLPVITSESGLLGSPKRAETQIDMSMLFEPRLTVCQITELSSSTNAIFNGLYKVCGFTHAGIISPTGTGERTTKVSLWKGEQAIKIVPGSAP